VANNLTQTIHGHDKEQIMVALSSIIVVPYTYETYFIVEEKYTHFNVF